MPSNNSTNLPEGYALLGGLAHTAQDGRIAIAWIALFSTLFLLNLIRALVLKRAVWGSTEFACSFLIVKNALRFVSSRSGTLNSSRIAAEQILTILALNFFMGAVSNLVDANLAIFSDADYSDGVWFINFLVDMFLWAPAGLAAMILGCWAAGSLLRLDQGSESVSEVVVRCRIASAALFLAVACLFCIGVVWGGLINSYCTGRRFSLLVIMSALLVVSTAYTMALFRHHNPPIDFSSKGKVVFAVLFELPLFLLGFLLMTLDLPLEFGMRKEDKEKWIKKSWDKTWTWKKTWGGKKTTTITRTDAFGRQTTQTVVEYPA